MNLTKQGIELVQSFTTHSASNFIFTNNVKSQAIIWGDIFRYALRASNFDYRIGAYEQNHNTFMFLKQRQPTKIEACLIY